MVEESVSVISNDNQYVYTIENLQYYSHETGSGYVYEQTEESEEWNIIHPLGKFPSVTLVDNEGNEIVGDIQYMSANNIIVRFTTPVSGKAFLN